MVVSAAWDFHSGNTARASNSESMAAVLAHEGLPRLLLESTGGLIAQGTQSTLNTLGERVGAAGMAIRHLLNRSNATTGSPIASPARVSASSQPYPPGAPAPFHVSADAALLLFRDPLDTGGQPIEAFEVFVRQLDTAADPLDDPPLGAADLDRMTSAGVISASGGALWWNANPTVHTVSDWSSATARDWANAAFSVGSQSGA